MINTSICLITSGLCIEGIIAQSEQDEKMWGSFSQGFSHIVSQEVTLT